MMLLLKWLAGFLSGPLLQSGVDAFKAKLQSNNDHDRIAADLSGRELLVQQREIEVQGQIRIAEIGHFWEPEKLAFYVTLAFYAKCVIWDTMLGWGTTPALKGDVSIWAGMIMGFYFSKRTVENAIRIFKK